MKFNDNWKIISKDLKGKIKLKRLKCSKESEIDDYHEVKTKSILKFKIKKTCILCNITFYQRDNTKIIKSELNNEEFIINTNACTSCNFILGLDLLDIKPDTQRKNELCSNFLTNLVEEKCPKILQKGTLIYYCT